MTLRQRLSLLAVSLVAVLGFAGLLTPAPAGAQGVLDICKQAGAKSSDVCKASGGNNLSGPNGIILKVANIFAYAGGVGAVFVMMIGGFMMITANGDTGKATSGRAAFTYALIGLLVIVFARTIIGFVMTRFL